MIQLSAKDTSFLHLEGPNTPWNGGVVLIYDRTTAPGELSFDDVVEHFRQRLHLVEALHMKVVRVPGNLDRPYWVEEADIDLDHHLRYVTLPAPGDWRQLCDAVAEIVAQPVDQSRPLWEVHMIDGLDALDRLPKGSFALVLKVHHAALDGKSFLAIMDILQSVDPQSSPPPPPDKSHRVEPEPTPAELLMRAAMHAVAAPMVAARAFGGALPGISRAAIPALWHRLLGDNEPKPLSPQTRFNTPIGPDRSFGACFFDLAETKPIRKAVEGATVTDIATSVFGGALRTYLGEIGELPTTTMKAAMMIDVRSLADRVGGNQISAMFTTLATDIEDPLERLAAVRASTKGSKNVSATIDTRRVSELLELVPEAVIAPSLKVTWSAGNRSQRGLFNLFNTAVTGMAGPPTALYLGGAKLVHLIGFGPVTDGLGLINIHSSYNGEFVMTFSADRAAMPDPERYEACIYEAFEELRKAVRPQRKRK